MNNFEKFITENKIEVIAWDFDRTLMKVHTQGEISAYSKEELQKKVTELGKQVSKDFLAVYHSDFGKRLKHCVASHADEYYTSTDTKLFLGGKKLIRVVLEQKDIKDMPIFARNVYWHRNGSMEPGKKWHLQQIASLFSMQNASHILLIDDDGTNVSLARTHGFQAAEVLGDNGFDLNQLSFA